MPRPRWWVPPTVALVALASAAGCSGDDGAAPPPDPRAEPETVVEAVLEAWQARGREAADRLGTDEAMDVLFGITPPEERLRVAGCPEEPDLPDTRTCVVRGPDLSLLLTVQEQEQGWHVVGARAVQ